MFNLLKFLNLNFILKKKKKKYEKYEKNEKKKKFIGILVSFKKLKN